MATEGFDTVVVRLANSAVQTFTRDDYMKKPLGERVRLLVDGRVQFFLGGMPVSATQALNKPA